ncbi:MAG TPA: hypothetical protein VK074_07685, partial [Fodinibius sp.]|nr:hypothetical protein [Fodinibius sp.]
NTEGTEMGLKPLYWRFLSGLGLKSRGNSFFSNQKLLLPGLKSTGYLSFQNKLLYQHRGHRDAAEAPESSIELFLAMIYVVQDKSDYET